jgi:hypothetical protein
MALSTALAGSTTDHDGQTIFASDIAVPFMQNDKFNQWLKRCS